MDIQVQTGRPNSKDYPYDGRGQLILRVLFRDLTDPPSSAEVWWDGVQPAVADGLRRYFKHPLPPSALTTSTDDISVTMAIAKALLKDRTYDVTAEVLPEIKDAAIYALSRHFGLPHKKGVFE